MVPICPELDKFIFLEDMDQPMGPGIMNPDAQLLGIFSGEDPIHLPHQLETDGSSSSKIASTGI